MAVSTIYEFMWDWKLSLYILPKSDLEEKT